MNIPGVNSRQVCMDNCDMNEKCMGWSYKADSRMCWGLNSITGVVAVAGVISGSCVGKQEIEFLFSTLDVHKFSASFFI